MGASPAGVAPMGVVGNLPPEGLFLQMQYLEGEYGLEGHGRARQDDHLWSRRATQCHGGKGQNGSQDVRTSKAKSGRTANGQRTPTPEAERRCCCRQECEVARFTEGSWDTLYTCDGLSPLPAPGSSNPPL